MDGRPKDTMLVLYDGECGFCKVMLAVLLSWDRARRLDAAPIQSPRGQRLLADMPAEDRLRSWHLLDESGALHSAGPAIPVVLATLPGGSPLVRLTSRFPAATERAYQWVGEHRVLLGRPLGARPRAWSTRVIAARTGARDPRPPTGKVSQPGRPD